jgi:hypothetical protein
MVGENLEKKISNLLEKHLPAKMSKKDFINLINYKNNILESSKETAPVKTPPKVKPGTKPGTTPDTPYKPKPGTKPAPKAKKNNMPNWLTYSSIGLNLN